MSNSTLSQNASSTSRLALLLGRPIGTSRSLTVSLLLGALCAWACSSGSADPQGMNQGGSTSNNGGDGDGDGDGSGDGDGDGDGVSGSSNGSNGGSNTSTGGSTNNGGTSSSTGGTQAAGGSSGGASAGSASGGAASNEPSICDGATDIRMANNGFVDNLEDPAMDSDLFWDSYVDDMGGAAENRTFIAPGALGTGHAIHYSGSTGTTPGMAYAGLTRSLGCTNVSEFDGLSFWAMGTDGLEIFLQVGTPETQKEGGDCLELCYDHPEKSIILTDQWTQYTVTWDELGQQGFGGPATFQGMTVLLNWRTAIGDFDFTIDEVSFFAGDAPTDPVLPPGGSTTPSVDGGI